MTGKRYAILSSYGLENVYKFYDDLLMPFIDSYIDSGHFNLDKNSDMKYDMHDIYDEAQWEIAGMIGNAHGVHDVGDESEVSKKLGKVYNYLTGARSLSLLDVIAEKLIELGADNYKNLQIDGAMGAQYLDYKGNMQAYNESDQFNDSVHVAIPYDLTGKKYSEKMLPTKH